MAFVEKDARMVEQVAMSFDLQVEGSLVIIDVEGSINSAHSPQLREVITEAFTREIAGLIVDLDGVNYMDSSGLATMVEGFQLAEERNGRFVLAGVLDDRVRHMFEITRLSDLFEHYESLDDAKKNILTQSQP